MNILAVESSCDETAAAVVTDGRTVRSSVVASSTTMHRKYGGIVPEVAAREQLRCIIPTIRETLQQADTPLTAIDALAVTYGPGLIGSLLVGVETVKALAMVTGKPVIPVHHVIAHMYANLLDPVSGTPEVSFPAISLVVSGGHTELFVLESWQSLRWLGGTVDDAAGEAFDKAARLLGFANLGGPAIQQAAAGYHPPQPPLVRLPRPMLDQPALTFSFSGLKTAIVREWQKQPPTPLRVSAFAHEIQEAITDVLVRKTMLAAARHQARSLLISGGVAANSRLRTKFAAALSEVAGAPSLHIPPLQYCTDNAAYIAAYAYQRNSPVPWQDITARPDLSVERDI